MFDDRTHDKKTVTFANSFKLGDFEEVLPPGIYEVETDEELLEGLSFQAYRRIRIRLRTHKGLEPTRRGVIHTPEREECRDERCVLVE